MSTHPYKSLPDQAFWSRSISNIQMNDVDPVVQGAFLFSETDKIATAGSCFAQHIARVLQKEGFNYFVSETIHPLAPRALKMESSYGEFTARYGNIYTSTQLVQLFDRAYGTFSPDVDYWVRKDGKYCDPFRPNIEPNGFFSVAELRADREKHFRAVRRAFEELDVFVFTLGLTEAWMAKSDGAVYPLCPGVAGGEFDDSKHEFKNLSVADVASDMALFIEKLRSVNPDAKVILTVSPVPLVATAVDQHVLLSTTYSKSVLRVAAEEVCAKFENVAYFPSYEIITGSFNNGRYYLQDARSVHPAGVAHVMRLLLKHYTKHRGGTIVPVAKLEEESHANHLKEMENLVKVACDEEALDK